MSKKNFKTEGIFRGLLIRAGIIFLLLLLLTMFGLFLKSAQAQQPEQKPPDRSIDSKIQAEIIDSVSQALNEIYVFPDMAKEMEKTLREKYKKKDYKDITSLNEFARKLTEDLQKISRDRHLHAHFMPDEILSKYKDGTLTDEEKKRELDERRHNNFCFKEIKLLEGNIGYLDFRCFDDATDAGATAIAAMNFLAYADAIIFDMRQNGGGDPSMIQLITSYLLEKPTHLNSFYVRKSDSIEQYWTQAYVQGPRLTDVDVYILTSDYTFSGAEEFTYNLKNLKRGTVIGETTGGGAHPTDLKLFPNLNLGIYIPYGKAINPISGTNWEGTGITPDIEVPQEKALDVAHLKALEKLLEKTEDPQRQAAFKWAIEGLKVKLNPVTLEESQLKIYVGQYGPRKIWIEEGKLYYQRGENPRFRLIPMGNHMFMVEELDYFRLQFIVDEKGESTEVIGHYSDGYTDSHKKSK
ncbi:MAG: S41 family peptidase [candidate division Zixibacteria bacterium]|nr:S41 family peptidase [candidate division Zixibacteria bacterium]